MNVKRITYKIYESFQRVIAPTLKYSQDFYEAVLKTYVGPDTKWLDVGCGHQVLPAWRSEGEKELVDRCDLIVGIDYDLPSLQRHRSVDLRVRGELHHLPFQDDSFDLVTANMVVEHLYRPNDQFLEISRILRPGGLFIFHTPNAHGYITVMSRLFPEGLKKKLIALLEERAEDDVFETHYKANSKKQIRDVAKMTGFEVVKLRMLVTDGAFVLIPPLSIAELIWIRILMTKPFAAMRTNIIAILQKVSGNDGNNGGDKEPIFSDYQPAAGPDTLNT